MNTTLAVLAGDGVGPEITKEAIKVLQAVAAKYQHHFTFKEGLIGGAAIDKTGNPFPEETQALCKHVDAIIFGAIGDPKYDNDPKIKVRPEQGLLAMRKTLGLYANIRPVFTYPSLAHKSPLKDSVVKDVDFIVVRELTGGIYFGEPRGRDNDGNRAFDTCVYSREEIERVARVAFALSGTRKKKLTLVDKANVLETSRLWRETIQMLSKEYKDIVVEYMFVDNAAMQIIKRPQEFDVILTENMFGDILTDEASVITGSIGLLPSASIGAKTALYEPIHGSYPKATGKGTANPIGTILSVAMMLEHSFQLSDEAKDIRDAVTTVIERGNATADIASNNVISTSEVGDEVVRCIRTQ